MAETPKSTFRFDDEVRRAIASLLIAKYGRDKTEAVSKAILEAKERLNGGVATVSIAPTVADSGSGEGVVFPFKSVCKHGGETFGSFTKHATICIECKRAGHCNDPRDCPACLDRGTGGL